ncbi:MAG: leucine-rich repeat protein [Lachnospiraceae bacterium]|nr:leucine-rich repeat protein [Lachnospiraceae bacterium]
MQIHNIGSHCFNDLIINYLCIEDGVKYLEDCALENAFVCNAKLPRGMKIGERCFANSQLTDILPQETFLNCKRIETIHTEFGVNTISYDVPKGFKNLKEAYFYIVKSVETGHLKDAAVLQS